MKEPGGVRGIQLVAEPGSPLAEQLADGPRGRIAPAAGISEPCAFCCQGNDQEMVCAPALLDQITAVHVVSSGGGRATVDEVRVLDDAPAVGLIGSTRAR